MTLGIQPRTRLDFVLRVQVVRRSPLVTPEAPDVAQQIIFMWNNNATEELENPIKNNLMLLKIFIPSQSQREATIAYFYIVKALISLELSAMFVHVRLPQNT